MREQSCLASLLSAAKATSRKSGGATRATTFAAADALVPIVVAELSNAMPSMPLAFSEQSGRYTLVALLSLSPARNMFVGT